MSRKETTARERATMIVQVQAGRMTVKEAAEALEISPKTYHEWEKRALESMMEGLTNREPGRPSSSPDPEVLKLQRKVKELETHVMIMEKTAELRAHLLAEAKLKEQTKKKGRTHGRTRAQRRRLAAATPAGMGTIRQGCRALRLQASSFYKVRVESHQRRMMKEAIHQMSWKYPRYGYRRITVMLRREGWHVGTEMVQRCRRAQGLQVKERQRKMRRLGLSTAERQRATHPRHVWSWDFIQDRTETGGAFKMLTIIDEHSRQCLKICKPPKTSILPLPSRNDTAWRIGPAFLHQSQGQGQSPRHGRHICALLVSRFNRTLRAFRNPERVAMTTCRNLLKACRHQPAVVRHPRRSNGTQHGRP